MSNLSITLGIVAIAFALISINIELRQLTKILKQILSKEDVKQLDESVED